MQDESLQEKCRENYYRKANGLSLEEVGTAVGLPAWEIMNYEKLMECKKMSGRENEK